MRFNQLAEKDVFFHEDELFVRLPDDVYLYLNDRNFPSNCYSVTNREMRFLGDDYEVVPVGLLDD